MLLLHIGAVCVLASAVSIFAQSFHWGAVVFVQRPQNSFNSEANSLNAHIHKYAEYIPFMTWKSSQKLPKDIKCVCMLESSTSLILYNMGGFSSSSSSFIMSLHSVSGPFGCACVYMSSCC